VPKRRRRGAGRWDQTGRAYNPAALEEALRQMEEDREPMPVKPAPVTRRFVCPICGGPHSRSEHWLPENR
jgi:hypothetical protein